MFGLRDSRFHVQNAFRGKYVTAEIEDEGGNLYVVPIKKKYVIHGHFFVKLGSEIFIFKIQHDKIKMIRNWGTEGIAVLHYSTKHFLPLDLTSLADLEEFKRNNPSIKRIDEMQAILLGAARALEEERRNDSTLNQGLPVNAITLPEAVEYVMQGADPSSPVTVERLAEYTAAMDRLGPRMINTPISLVTDFLDETIQSSSLAIIAMLRQLEVKHFQWKAIANPAKTPFQHWALVIVIGLAAAIIGGGLYALTGGDIGAIGSGGITFEDIERMAREGVPPPGSTAPPASTPPDPVVPPPAAPAPAPTPNESSAGPPLPTDALSDLLTDPGAAFEQARGLGAGIIPGLDGGPDTPPAPSPSAAPTLPAGVVPAPPIDLEAVAARMDERRAAEAEQIRREVAANDTVDRRPYGAMPPAEWEAINKIWCGYHAEACIEELERLALRADGDQPREDRINNCMNRYEVPDPDDPEGTVDKWAPCGLSAVQADEYTSRAWESLFSHPNFTRWAGGSDLR